MAWPQLDYAQDRPTIETCHLVLQLIGKLPTRLHPWVNHGWHVAVRVSPRGFVTRAMPAPDGRHFTAELDMLGGSIRVACTDGGEWQAAVQGRTIAELHGDLLEILTQAGLPAPLHGAPNELPEVIPFSEDTRPRDWDADAAKRLHAAFACADSVFTAFRAKYLGKSSPSHLFWGSFDLAVTRFSGREAPRHPGGFPNLPDRVTREAYSHEVISAGFWPGGNGVDEAAFYAYAYPSPDGLGNQGVRPDKAWFHADLGEFVVTYADIAGSPSPEDALMDFLQSTYEAAAGLMDWPDGLTTGAVSYGQPPRTR